MPIEQLAAKGLLGKAALGRASARQLLMAYGSILDELTTRGIVRTRDAPTGQLAERLAQAAFGGELAPNSEKSWDCRLPDGKTLQVKSRVLGRDKPHLLSYRQLSPFRTWTFDEALVILFAWDYSVHRAVRIPRDLIEPTGKWSKHVNGHIVHATDALLGEGVDVTDQVNIALLSL